MSDTMLPVAIIGGGPVGLAAAAHLLAKGDEPVVFETGPAVGASISAWGHVRFFSPWRYVVDAAADKLLAASGWAAPDPEAYPTGREFVVDFLAPLAALPEMRSRIRLDSRVVSVTRAGFDKMTTTGRDDAPFHLTVQAADGSEAPFFAKAVIDASGTYTSPNPLGAGGVPAIGEHAVADRIFYGIPDVRGEHRHRYASKRVLVVGSGHSAFNVLLDLVTLSEEEPGTSITWLLRRPGNRLQHLFGGGANDALPARGELGARVQRLVADGRLQMATGFKITRLTRTDDGIIVAGQDNALAPIDEIVATTGFRPDLTMLSELRLSLDPAVESPSVLAPLIDPNVHSCGSVPPHGEAELRHPETGAYIAGMKSYGRAPTFLMLTGYEQVRSIACAIVGDWEGARKVLLVLPETGVCSSNIVFDSAEPAASACCGLSTPATAPVSTSCCSPAEPSVVRLTLPV